MTRVDYLLAAASRRDAPVVCERCGRKVERKSRQQRFCSGRCQEKARTRVRKAFLARATGAPGSPLKRQQTQRAATGKNGVEHLHFRAGGRARH